MAAILGVVEPRVDGDLLGVPVIGQRRLERATARPQPGRSAFRHR